MSDALLPYFERELVATRRLAAEFARAHPKIAGRLRLLGETAEDPHVARLLDGVAFLAARVQMRLDDSFPELTDALLGVLYPHYLAPMPSAAILQLAAKPEARGAARLPRGAALWTETPRGQRCDYTTTADAVLWPLELETVRLTGLPLAAPAHPRAAAAKSVLRIALRCATPEGRIGELGVTSLRFHLRGEGKGARALHELLGAHVLGLACGDGPADPRPALAGAEAVTLAGFDAEEALLPWPARSFAGFRLLGEYFAFPQKFLFVDVALPETRGRGQRMEVFVYLDQAAPELERSVSADSLALGCVPAINLFRQECDPVPLDHTVTEYRIEPSAGRAGALEVWDLLRVRETSGDGRFRPWVPFYRLAEAGAGTGEAPAGSYALIRRPSPTLPGSDAYLAPYDPEFDPAAPAESVLSIDAWCLNRDLPTELPVGGGHPRFRLTQGHAGVAGITCLAIRQNTLRPPLRAEGFWPLVSLLSLGHLSVADGAETLREVLRLHDLRDTEESRAAVASLLDVSSRPGVARLPLPPGVSRLPPFQAGTFCRGLDVTLEWEPRGWADGGLFLLAAVLDRFLALHATVNSFTRVACTLRGRDGRVAAWPPRAGARVLL